MKATIATKSLLAILADLSETAGWRGIHLSTRMGYWKDEPGQTTLLAGVSTTGIVGGHTWALASGTLPPTVWSVDDCKAIKAVFAAPVKLHGADHSVDIEVTGSGETQQVTIRETPALFDMGLELSFTADDATRFPYEAVVRALSDADTTNVSRAGQVVPDSRLTSWGGAAMRALLAVEKRRGDNLRLWRLHSEGRHLAQIGDEWRGFIYASPCDEQIDAPSADLNASADEPDTPEAMERWSADLRKELGIPEPGASENRDDGEQPGFDDDGQPAGDDDEGDA